MLNIVIVNQYISFFMVVLKIVVRVIFFITLIFLGAYFVEFIISSCYKFMLTQYSLPKVEFDITLLSFFISALFLTFISLISNYWNVSKFVKA